MQALSKFLIIFLAVTLGTFSADRLTDVYHYYQIKIIASYMQKKVEAANAEERVRLAEQQIYDENMRIRSKKGANLYRNCQDWKRMYKQIPTHTSEIESKRQCSIYEKFIRTGVYPSK
ncbi:hypothetical protein Q4583_17525 [Neptunomonas phycophila]|uniref:hypothetical protein n=1 Tax=Neptunomonas phycophila TaxID=1572645 RepID=UPI0026E17C97|nr:hypothetical protein [Neptunomonas phycophila]MDO6785916.1 hypothetical protein [Neptunomonas phycophila]